MKIKAMHLLTGYFNRDTLQVRLGPTLPELDEIPEICRHEVVEWNQHVTKLGELLTGLLCEGLGVEKERLKELTFLDSKVMVAHYYPYCPQSDLTVESRLIQTPER